MNHLAELRARFARALAPFTDDPSPLAGMVHAAQDAKFGDYQANCAMPLAKTLKKPPRDVAAEIVARLDVADLCEPPEIAGPGFINLRLKDDRLAAESTRLANDPRLGVAVVAQPRKYVVDYSGPNVAKPMHVGHLRSTVIGDALTRVLRFLGHTVVTDNHLGDWGTQFGMLIYGYRNFLDAGQFETNSVEELARLYRLVHQIAGYQAAVVELPQLRTLLEEKEAQAKAADAAVKQHAGPDKEKKELTKKAVKAKEEIGKTREKIAETEAKIAAVESSPPLKARCDAHPRIADRAREETAKLHAGDAANKALWDQFMPACQTALDEMYRRLGIEFDVTLGESFYNPMLAGVVEELVQKGIAVESDGALCVFHEGKKAPFLVRKSDGAFTYATTDLATLKYRVDTLRADCILYVVGAPQAEHFELLFATGRQWGYVADDDATVGRVSDPSAPTPRDPDPSASTGWVKDLTYSGGRVKDPSYSGSAPTRRGVECRHISFGSVLDDRRQMFRTRSGGTVGLETLLDEAVTRARQIVDANHDEGELDEATRQQIAEIVGVGGIKYADLHHNRESDYVFSWDKMLATQGDTGTYMQYAYARTCGIFRKGGVSREAIRAAAARGQAAVRFTHPSERALALQIHRFAEVLDEVLVDYRPSQLTAWLFETAKVFSTFFNECPVKDAPDEATRLSRFLLCDLMGRGLETGLGLLGIPVRERM